MQRTRVGPHTLAWRAMGPPDAPPLVMVHGFIISHRYLVPLARHLADARRALLVDLPGFGRSSKPRDSPSFDEQSDVLAAWMEAIGVPRADVLGNSMGCQVSAALAQRHPERVDRLVLLGPTTDRHTRTVPRQAALLAADMLRERASLPFIHVPDYVRCGPRRILQTLGHVMRDSIEERAPRVEAPTLVVRGERDVLVSQRFVEELAALFPRGELLVLPASPHACNYSAPDLTAAAVRLFLERDRPMCRKGQDGEDPSSPLWRQRPSPPRSARTSFTG